MILGDLYVSCYKVDGPESNKLEISNGTLELNEGINFQFALTSLEGGTTIVTNFKIISNSNQMRTNFLFTMCKDSNFKLLDSVFK